jgi:putative toxin-antitoxin system antitoxin component (TIGR02293 family)
MGTPHTGMNAHIEQSGDFHVGDTHASEITVLAERVFGSSDAARDWLLAPNAALGHEVPSQILATRGGARRVEAVLIRIEHGVFE